VRLLEDNIVALLPVAQTATHSELHIRRDKGGISLEHDELCTLRLLLSDLLALNSSCELLAVGEVGDRDILENEVELCCSVDELLADTEDEDPAEMAILRSTFEKVSTDGKLAEADFKKFLDALPAANETA